MDLIVVRKSWVKLEGDLSMLRIAKSWDGLIGEGKRPATTDVFKTSSEKLLGIA